MTIEVRCGMGWMPDGRPGDLRPATVEEYAAEIERLRAGYEDIKRATVAGRVCDDVAWFDTITTLYDFCDLMLCGDMKLADHQQSPDSKK